MVFFGLYGVSIGFGCMRMPCHNSGGVVVVVVAISFRSVLFVSYVWFCVHIFLPLAASLIIHSTSRHTQHSPNAVPFNFPTPLNILMLSIRCLSLLSRVKQHQDTTHIHTWLDGQTNQNKTKPIFWLYFTWTRCFRTLTVWDSRREREKERELRWNECESHGNWEMRATVWLFISFGLKTGVCRCLSFTLNRCGYRILNVCSVRRCIHTFIDHDMNVSFVLFFVVDFFFRSLLYLQLLIWFFYFVFFFVFCALTCVCFTIVTENRLQMFSLFSQWISIETVTSNEFCGDNLFTPLFSIHSIFSPSVRFHSKLWTSESRFEINSIFSHIQSEWR